MSHEDARLGGIRRGLGLEEIEDKWLKGRSDVGAGGGGLKQTKAPYAGSSLVLPVVMTAQYNDKINEISSRIITGHNIIKPQ